MDISPFHPPAEKEDGNKCEPGFDYLLKLIIIGDSGVGKTNLQTRFIKNVFIKGSKATIGVDFSHRTLEIQGRLIKAQIWDTAGQDRFRSVASTFYRNTAAAVLVYDISNRKSFESLQQWLEELRGYCPGVMAMVIGNKSDLQHIRSVTIEEGREFAEKEGFLFMETSALTAENVDEAFITILEKVVETHLQRLREEDAAGKKKNKHQETKGIAIVLEKESNGNQNARGLKKEPDENKKNKESPTIRIGFWKGNNLINNEKLHLKLPCCSN